MKRKMKKVLVVCTAATAMTAFSGTAFGATLDLESKTAVADAKDGAGDIQEAINQIPFKSTASLGSPIQL